VGGCGESIRRQSRLIHPAPAKKPFIANGFFVSGVQVIKRF
jgi:hypothetical protein